MSVDQHVSGRAEKDLTEKAAVREQLERLLGSSYFNHSRRFPTFLRFVVEHALDGEVERLKERTLGIEVFGRAADYDTASDPIVRVTAAEIRKRIAQYYEGPGRDKELRVTLPSGSYVPQFQWPDESKAAPEEVPGPPDAASPLPARKTSLRVLWAVAGALVLVVIGLVAGWMLRSPRKAAFDFFWGPVLQSRDPVLFCVADQNEYSAIVLRDATDPSRQSLLKDNLTAVVFDDLGPVVRIAGILQANGKQYSLRGENATSLADLRDGTTVVVGAFDNAWALRLTRPLRFHFDNDTDMKQFRIVDSAPHPHGPWVVSRVQQLDTNNYKDYALVARFIDPTSGKLTIVAAGVARGGTMVAGEFLTNPDDLAQIEQAARRAGNKPNMEFVLSTQIINGDPGIPRMEASYFW